LRIYPTILWLPNWTPRYNWNIVESGIKHHNPNLFNIICSFVFFFDPSSCLLRSLLILIYLVYFYLCIFSEKNYVLQYMCTLFSPYHFKGFFCWILRLVDKVNKKSLSPINCMSSFVMIPCCQQILVYSHPTVSFCFENLKWYWFFNKLIWCV
jgi:hypothetical protein